MKAKTTVKMTVKTTRKTETEKLKTAARIRANFKEFSKMKKMKLIFDN